MFVLNSRTDCYLIQGDLLTDALDNNFQHICQFLTDYSDGVSSSSFLSIHDTLAVGMLTHLYVQTTYVPLLCGLSNLIAIKCPFLFLVTHNDFVVHSPSFSQDFICSR